MLPSLLLPSSFHAALTTTLAVALLSSYFLASLVEGHGYMLEPPSRSYSAWQTGLDYGAAAGVPPRDYCAWCININEGVCGITQSGINYDVWLDSTGQPMPWQSQATYTAGDVITVSSILTAHHEGHLEVWGCPKGRASTQDCFRQHKLNFVDDVSFGMPQDPNYPLRGYFYGGWDYSDVVMTMRFQLPETLVGEEVLLQWWYFTANSCTPEGYADYMARNNLPDSFWSPDTITCTPDMYPDVFAGFEPYRVAERFLNCAEVTIQAEEVPPSSSFTPTRSPITLLTPAPNDGEVPQSPQPIPIDPTVVGTCGMGSQGNGICPAKELCCSKWGYCGTSSGHCGGSTTPPPSLPLLPPNNDNVSDNNNNTPDVVVNPSGDTSRLIAYVGNWQECPSDSQIAQYTHIVIAFAVSYSWSPGKNQCSETCEITAPAVCENTARPDLISKWKSAGKKVILSFGGAGMGGSWDGDNNDCWDYCYGREDQVVNRLTSIVNEMDLDGVDIDYEYYYEDNQNGSGFTKGAQAQKFLKDITVGLRNKLPTNSELTHAPMEPDLEPGTAYYSLLKGVVDKLDYIMPQYYNGYQKPHLNWQGALDHFTVVTNGLFGGDASKVVFGFCINECGSFNVNGNEATEVMENLGNAYPCNGGAFFWVAKGDGGASWSIPVRNQLQSNSNACALTEGAPNNEEPPPPTPSVCKNDNKFKYNGKIKCKKIHRMKKIRRNKICNKKHKSKDETTNKRMKVKFYCPKACRKCKPSNKNKI